MSKVIISEDAFVIMLAAAVEVYTKEAYGLLLGSKVRKDFRIDYAVPYQSAIRKTGEVSVDEDAEQRLIAAINHLKGYHYMGEFHSHPGGRKGLSKYDKKDLRKYGARMSVLVWIGKAGKYKPWRYDIKDKSLSGTLDHTYKIMVKAYRCEHDDRRIQKLRIQCDFVRKLNKRAKKSRA